MLQEPNKLIDAQTRVSDNRSQGTAVELLMIGDDDLYERVIAANDHVAAFSSFEIEADLLQRREAVSAGNPR